MKNTIFSYLANQPYLPVAFLSNPDRISTTSGYAPMYRFNVQWSANWAASFGYNRSEHYTDYETQIINNVSRRVAVTRTKTVTDWRPSNGRAQGEVVLAAYAGRLLPQLAISLLRKADFSKAVRSIGRSISVPVEPFSFSHEQVWTSAIEKQVDDIIDKGVRSWAQGDRQRDWSWQGNSHYSTEEVLCPFECIEVTFKERNYQFWIDGSDTTRISHEKLPEDASKRRSVTIGFLPTVFLLVIFIPVWQDRNIGTGWSVRGYA